MSDAEKVQRLFDAFASDFVLPLLAGKEAKNIRFVPAHLLQSFALGAYSDNDVAMGIHEALVEAVADLAVVSHLPFPENGAMAAAMAGHNLVALTDPLLDRAFARGSRSKVLGWIAELTEAMGAPHTRGEALTRHAVISRLLQLRREDTVVKNWAYTYRFYGRRPPANVTAMPRLRFVREEKKKRPITALLEAGKLDALGDDNLEKAAKNDTGFDLSDSLSNLVARSPITLLLEHDLCEVEFGGAVLAVLSDGGLRHGIEQAIVRAGTQGVAAPFGRAFRKLAALGPDPEFLYPAIAFLAELQILEVFDERKGHRPRDEPAVGDEELFSAILPALFEVEGPMRSLIELEEADLARVRERAALRAEQAGADAVAFAKAVIERAGPLTRPLGSHNTAAGW